MAGRIPDQTLEDILSRVDIVAIISEYIPLKKSGKNFKAVCPFHHEKTPSFMVSADRQIFHCFGCGESGNAFKFLMRHERMDFPETVEYLARKAGIALPENKKEDGQTASLSTQLYKLNELATLYYHQNLMGNDGVAARQYLLKRSISEETIKAFKLGLSFEKWDGLIVYLRAKGVPLFLIEKAGLIVAKENGGYYDRFRNRIMFPIFDIKGRTLGFGARLFTAQDKEKEQAKYINSPETPVYTKGRHLFGLQAAKDAIRDQDCAVIVEGNLDFMMPFQEGVRNIVASLGTALTEEQVVLLKRFTQNCIFVYDADEAGQMAMQRSLDMFIDEGIELRIATLPEGSDPDSFVRAHGIERFKECLAQAQNIFEYKLRVARERYGVQNSEAKARVCAEVLATIGRFKNAVLKSEYIRRLSEDLGVKEEALLEELKKLKPEQSLSWKREGVENKPLKLHPTEKLLINMMLEETEIIHRIREHLEPGDFQDERTSKIVSVMFDLIGQGKSVEPKSLVNYIDDKEVLGCICEGAFEAEVTDEHKKKIVADCIKVIKNNRITLTKRRLQEEMMLAERSGDEESVVRLKEEFCNLIKKAGKK